MCTVLIPTVKSGQGHTRTINNRNAESRTVSHLLSKWYQTKMNTWSYFAGFFPIFKAAHNANLKVTIHYEPGNEVIT